MYSNYVSIFPGQGTTEAHMGQYWREHSGVFKRTFEGLLEHFKNKTDVSLYDIIMHHPEKLIATQWAQPAIYCYQVAAATMLATYNKPLATLGHSVGEFAAITCSGGMDMYTGLDLITARGELMQKTDPGKIIAVLSPPQYIKDLLHRHPAWECWIAAENDETITIVAGTPSDIDKCMKSLHLQAIRYLHIPGSTAFHTPLMEPIIDEWKKVCAAVKIKPLKIPFYSSVTQQMYTELPEDYLSTHMLARVRFHQTLNQFYIDFPDAICIEMGPNNRFQTYLKKRWNHILSLGPEISSQDKLVELEAILSSAY